MKNFNFIISRIKKYKFRYLMGIILLFIYVAINLKLINILGTTIDMLGESTINIDHINTNVRSIIFYSLWYAIIVMVWKPLIYSGAKRVKKDLHKEVYTHVCKVQYEYFTTKTHGDMLSYLHTDIEFIENLLSEKMVIILFAISTLIISICYLIITIPTSLTIITLLVIMGSSLLLYYFTFGLTKNYDDVRDLRLKNASKIQQIVEKIKTIKRFNKVEDFVMNFRKHAKNLEKKEMIITKKRANLIFIVDVYLQVSYAFIILYAGVCVMSNQITIGRFIEFTTYFSLLCTRNIKLAEIIPELKNISLSIYKIRRFLGVKQEIDNKISADLLGYKLTIKKLTLNPYEGENTSKKILNNLSFELEKGQTLGIVGRIGSGKSTLVNILSEIYEVKDNMVLIDDIDINKVSKESIRKIVEVIPENNYVFSETIMNNLTFFNNSYSLKEVEEACKKTCLHKQIKRMALKYDTVIGANGIYFTIGQKQRLRIARSFLTNKKIIIFDECFSGIDATTCKKIISNIRNEFKDKIVIIISNNINNVKWCNKILVMEEGKIVETGIHKELIKEDTIYKKMYDFQKKMNGGNINGNKA